MAEVLHEFPNLKDPYTGGSLMERTILIANTSNMPVAAREASIYTGMTIAEYYRDMGYRVAVLADSTSRWAEALREISSRLEEMPGEEGYPPYLASRLGSFYERAARVKCLGREDETGSITIVGAVSPPGGDFSEPVTQASMRMASTFWALDYDLAHQRHFPAINWISSFSLSYPTLARWYKENVDKDWMEMVSRVNAILQKEVELSEVVKIIGIDAIGESERVALDAAEIIREGYLRQSSYHPTDAFCSRNKQKKMLVVLLYYITNISEAIRDGFPLEKILSSPMREPLLRIMELPDNEIDGKTFELKKEISAYFKRGTEE
jgi:V/A-type H+-transporting ATPase subunit A